MGLCEITSSQVHTLTTPKGGQYQITLPDGSKVWLNANSTLKYPSHFSEEERVVELVGEAYFDVRHETLDMRRATSDSAPESHLKSQISNLKSDGKPFKVISNGQIVEVLGTQFNISAYPDDPATKTTLVEGKVKVALSSTPARLTTDDLPLTTYDSRLTTDDLRLTTKVLTPGEQATIRGATIETQQVDTEPYTAWKDGLFIFNNESLENILKRVSRWYDVEVSYQNENLRGLILWGKVSRDTPISSVLNALALTEKVQFKLETGTGKERRLTVMK